LPAAARAQNGPPGPPDGPPFPPPPGGFFGPPPGGPFGPPGGGRFGPPPGGPAAPLGRAMMGMSLPAARRDAALEAVQEYGRDIQRTTEMAESSLFTKMKQIL